MSWMESVALALVVIAAVVVYDLFVGLPWPRRQQPATRSVKLHNAHCPYLRAQVPLPGTGVPAARCDCPGVGWAEV